MLIKSLRRDKKMSQTKLAGHFGLPYQSVQKWENGTGKPTTDQLPTLSQVLGISVEELVERMQLEEDDTPVAYNSPRSNAKVVEYEQVVNLPYAPVPVRGSFIEMSDPEANYGQFDTYPARVSPGENVKGQIIFEVNGDSMEPRYPSGTKVRSKLVDPAQWPYLASGVYAFSYANTFVIKRLKDNDLLQRGYLILHSDNTDTGGITPVPVEQLRHIWKVIRIVDAPAD